MAVILLGGLYDYVEFPGIEDADACPERQFKFRVTVLPSEELCRLINLRDHERTVDLTFCYTYMMRDTKQGISYYDFDGVFE